MIHRRLRPSAGFTLVEVLVALVVAGAVSAAAFGVVASLAGSRRAVERARAAALPGAGARASLDAWLRGAAVFEGSGGFVAEDRDADGIQRDRLAFAVEDGGALWPGPRRVRLWTERATTGRSGLLAEVSPLGPGPESAETLVVAAAAGGLDLRYRVTVRGRQTWLAAWSADSILPEAVELRVLPAPEDAGDAGGGLPRLLRLPIRVPLRASPGGEGPDAG
jgi:prepilin-type N-terminal cleavage/methylation domain-containing protein